MAHYEALLILRLTNLFVGAGFKVIQVARQYDGQFLSIEARPGTIDIDSVAGCERILPDTHEFIRKFHNAYREKVLSWQQRLSNIMKQGKFVAGTGQQVIAPDFLKEYQPRTVIIFNPIYHAEIQQAVENMDINADLYVA